MAGLFDSYQRQINYLRVSVTDRCNLRCVYCSSSTVARLPHVEILSFEEIQRVVVAAAKLGITKVRLTGGEPLVRPQLSKLVGLISKIPDIDDLALTTNGILLGKYAAELKKAGLRRVNVSLDTLKEDRFKAITCEGRLADVLKGIEIANKAGLEPVKLNMVVMRGVNDDEVLDFAQKTVDGWHVRFIEYMPFNGDSFQTVPAAEIFEQVKTLGKLVPVYGRTGNGPAKYWQIEGAKGTIGFITPVTEHFCATCNRLRLTADGHLRPCLLDDDEIDLKKVLRTGASEDELKVLIRQAVSSKREHHHLNEDIAPIKRPMYQIGG